MQTIINGKDPVYSAVLEIERHFHGRERWFGAAGTPAAETHVADRMAGGINPFTLIAGNNTWGAWLQILGSSDTPVMAGYAYNDPHRYLVTAANSTNPYIIQVIAGESADIVANLAAGNYTETAFIAPSNNLDNGIQEIMSRRIPSGSKAWARCACIGSNGTTISLYFGIHEYVD